MVSYQAQVVQLDEGFVKEINVVMKKQKSTHTHERHVPSTKNKAIIYMSDCSRMKIIRLGWEDYSVKMRMII